MTDNFFDLGVTSVVAARLFAAIELEIGNSLPLGAIFRAPTIERLAALIEGGDRPARWTSLVPIQPEGSRQPIFCVHGGGGTVLHIEPLARRLGPDQPLYGLQSRGLYGSISPLATVEEMATPTSPRCARCNRRGRGTRRLLLRRARGIRDGMPVDR